MIPVLRRSRRIVAGRWRLHARAAAAAVVLLLVPALGLAACATGTSGSASPANNGQSFVQGSVGTTVFRAQNAPAAPKVTGTTLSGARLSLSHFRGHVLVMNFWGSWCTPCRSEAPALASLARQYRAGGVRFLGVDLRDSPASAKAFTRDFGISYPSLSDPSGQVALAFRRSVPPNGIPTTLVISRRGEIVGRVIGPVSYQVLRNLISTAMARPS